jgi:hypothetical protein
MHLILIKLQFHVIKQITSNVLEITPKSNKNKLWKQENTSAAQK